MRKILRASGREVALDAKAVGSLDVARIEQRRDRLASRARRQFALRGEAVLRTPA